MKSILKMDPKDRLTVDDLLLHTYFEGVAEEFGDINDIFAPPSQLQTDGNS